MIDVLGKLNVITEKAARSSLVENPFACMTVHGRTARLVLS